MTTVNGSRGPRREHLSAGLERVPAVVRARALRREGRSLRDIGEELGVPFSTLAKWLKRVEHIADDAAIRAEDLADRTWRNGRAAGLQLTEAEVAEVRGVLMETNRDRLHGSLPEALRRAQSLRPEVREFIESRLEAGRDPLTVSMRRQVRVAEPVIRAGRAPREAWLEYVQSPGSLQMVREEDGSTRLLRPGEQWTIDDGTLNFVCCVPIERPGDRCWERHGVVVGRWQFLLIADTRTYFVPGFCHTARPRSSYRAEDLLATFQMAFREHGVPPRIVLEKGISKSTLLVGALERLGVRVTHASSPHQKVAETIFNNCWTRLSGMPGQVGRFMGEEEAMNRLVQACRSGAHDPRQHFPMLSDVLRALHEAVRDWNGHLVRSHQYGQWRPAEFWARQAPAVLRPLNPADAWMFAPVVSRPLLVRGQDIRTTFNVMPGFSLQFNFSAPWLHEYYGARVCLHYNPHEPECDAVVTLAEDFNGERAGTVLGDVAQINWHARHNRRLLGIDEMEDRGRVEARKNAQALRRSVVSIRADGRVGAEVHEARNGVGDGAR
ncbi:MAG TPA: hypothetical protein P5169_07885, partial [Kiritimatiellia bacterium]|nr:hypothetical protein [Kiritimatiellia bacterium]